MVDLFILTIGGLLTLPAAVFFVFTAYTYYNHWKYSHIPSPKLPSFYLGHLSDFLRAKKEYGNDELPLPVMLRKWQQDVGSSTYVVHFPNRPFVVVTDPAGIKEISMQPKNEKPHSFNLVFATLYGERFLGNGLFTILDYETWKPKRKLYDPAFKKSYLQSILPGFNKCVDTFIDKLTLLADGVTPVPIKEHLADVALDVLSKVAFGSDFTARWSDQTLGLKRAKGNGKLTFLLENSFKGLQLKLQFPWYQYLHPLETEGYRETVRAIRIIGRDCIMKRINVIESGAEVPNDILTHIVQVASIQESVDIEELVDDFVTYYIAGQETTSNLLSFAVALAHLHPSVLECLQAEVKEVLGERTAVTKDDLEKLQYTEQVLLEILRMHPPVFGISKSAPAGGLTIGGYHIPANTMVVLPTAVLCRMPEYFDDPDTFNPDRFDPENKQPSSFVYFPFGLGHRSCIGRHFAMMEAKMILARLIQTFKLTLPPDYKLVAVQRATLQPRDSISCTLEPYS